MSDGKIHIPARKKKMVEEQAVIRLTPQAYNALVEIYNESTLYERDCKFNHFRISRQSGL